MVCPGGSLIGASVILLRLGEDGSASSRLRASATKSRSDEQKTEAHPLDHGITQKGTEGKRVRRLSVTLMRSRLGATIIASSFYYCAYACSICA